MPVRRIIAALAASTFFALVLCALTSRLVSHLHVLGSEQDATRWGMIDFRDVIYFPARAVMDGVNPYDSEPTDDPERYRGRYPVGNTFPVYSPLLLALAAPLQLLPYHTGMAVYALFNVACLLLVARLALVISKLNTGIAPALVLATLMLLSRPGQSNFYYGQLALPMVASAIVATTYSATHPGLSALALAFTTIKPTFGAPLLILLQLQGRWKASLGGGFLGGSIAALGFVTVFALCHSGRPPLETFTANMAHTESDPGFAAQTTGIRLDAIAVAERLTPAKYAATVRAVVPLALLAVSGLALGLLARRPNDQQDDWISTPLIMVTTLLCVFHAAYDGLLLTLPIVSLALGRHMTDKGKIEPLARWLLTALLLVPAVNVFSSRQFLRAIAPYVGQMVSTADDGWLWTLASILNGLALLIAWFILVAMAFRSVLQSRHSRELVPQLPALS